MVSRGLVWSRVARVLRNMAANLDVSALRIAENPLQKFEDNLRISLNKLKGKVNKHLFNRNKVNSGLQIE